jgi:hypothetical protein
MAFKEFDEEKFKEWKSQNEARDKIKITPFVIALVVIVTLIGLTYLFGDGDFLLGMQNLSRVFETINSVNGL